MIIKDDCARLTLFVTLAILIVYLALQLQILTICLIAAVTLASALGPLAEFLELKKIPRAVTVIVVYVFVFLVYCSVAGGLIPVLIQQAKSLWEHLPSYLDFATAGAKASAQKVLALGGPDLTHQLNSEDLRLMGLSMAQKALLLAFIP